MAPSDSKSGRPAFTLVEILVVVAIFAVLSTVGLISIRNSRNKTYLRDATNLLAASITKVQGYARAGRSVDRTPPAAGGVEVPRSFGISIDALLGIRVFADFPPDIPDQSSVPYCLEYSGGTAGCASADPLFPKADTVMENLEFGNDIQVVGMSVSGLPLGTQIFYRVDLVYVVPTAETILYYRTGSGAIPSTWYMERYTGDPASITVNLTLLNNATGETSTLTIRGGQIGGSVTIN